ncbi:hypothetical protein ACFW3A_31135, partial [Streptomyces pilosus]|uniref:hypothetical protein n=1 Tax=Streptomyces pilosus TaxID=28893 RepID=UPI0036B875F1
MTRRVAIAVLTALATLSLPHASFANDGPRGDGGIECGLLALAKPLDVAVGDQADGKAEEGLVDVVAS